jgi:hypothetical protein
MNQTFDPATMALGTQAPDQVLGERPRLVAGRRRQAGLRQQRRQAIRLWPSIGQGNGLA